MARLEVVTPVAKQYEGGKVPPAPRLDRLDGKTIALFWNAKPGGDIALDRAGALLGERFPGARFKTYIGSVGAGRTSASDEDVAKIAQECQAVIATTAD